MYLEYLAHSCFLLTGDNGYRVMIDPYGDELGYKKIQRHTDLILLSHGHSDHSNIAGIPGSARVFSSAGNLDIDDIKVRSMIGKHGGQENSGFTLVFSIMMDGIKFAHLGDLGEVPQEALLSFLEGTQVMMIPVGGTVTMDAANAGRLVNLVKPLIVIPMHYMTAALDRVKYPLAPVEDFTSLFTKTGITRDSVLEISSNKLPEKTEVLVMNHTY